MAIRRYAARVLVLDPAGRVLLFNWANRSNGTNWWATPGGGLEAGEKSVDAARRELMEECGIQGTDLQGPLWRSDHFFRSGADLVHQFETFFATRVNSDAVRTDGLDAVEADLILGHRWWSAADLDVTSERVFPVDLADRLRAIQEAERASI
jgi:8-oxo-dGTP pyrophosphatase MutT (NUDIX family)